MLGPNHYTDAVALAVESMPGWDIDLEYSCYVDNGVPRISIYQATLCTPHRRIPLELTDLNDRSGLEQEIAEFELARIEERYRERRA
jgi:hypothetical protein